MSTQVPTILPTTPPAEKGYHTPVPSLILVSIGIVIGVTAMLCYSRYSETIRNFYRFGFNKERTRNYSEINFMGPGSRKMRSSTIMTEIFNQNYSKYIILTICQGPSVDQLPLGHRINDSLSPSEITMFSDKFSRGRALGSLETKRSVLNDWEEKSCRKRTTHSVLNSYSSRRSWSPNNLMTHMHYPEGSLRIVPFLRSENVSSIPRNGRRQIPWDVCLSVPTRHLKEGTPSTNFLSKNEVPFVNQHTDSFSNTAEPTDALSEGSIDIGKLSVHAREGVRSFTQSKALLSGDSSLVLLPGGLSYLASCATTTQSFQGVNPLELVPLEAQNSDNSSCIEVFDDSFTTDHSFREKQIIDKFSPSDEKWNLEISDRQSDELRLTGYDSYLTIASRSKLNDEGSTPVTPVSYISSKSMEEIKPILKPANSIMSSREDPSPKSMLNVTMEKSSIINIAPLITVVNNLRIQQNHAVSISVGEGSLIQNVGKADSRYFVV